jgi:hypothetical protein
MDFSLLKPVDSKVKKGDSVISGVMTDNGRRVEIVAGPNQFSEFCTEDCRGEYFVIMADYLYYAPLGWLDERPIYPGSILFIGNREHKISTENQLQDVVLSGTLSWNRTSISRWGWLNIYPSGRTDSQIYDTEILADKHAYTHRVACIKVSWEE